MCSQLPRCAHKLAQLCTVKHDVCATVRTHRSNGEPDIAQAVAPRLVNTQSSLNMKASKREQGKEELAVYEHSNPPSTDKNSRLNVFMSGEMIEIHTFGPGRRFPPQSFKNSVCDPGQRLKAMQDMSPRPRCTLVELDTVVWVAVCLSSFSSCSNSPPFASDVSFIGAGGASMLLGIAVTNVASGLVGQRSLATAVARNRRKSLFPAQS